MENNQNDPLNTIIIGCDHAAYPLKEKVKAFLAGKGYPVEDVGAYSESSVDYPEFGVRVASQVSMGKYPRGILLCGTGIGMSMVANKSPCWYQLPYSPSNISKRSPTVLRISRLRLKFYLDSEQEVK